MKYRDWYLCAKSSSRYIPIAHWRASQCHENDNSNILEPKLKNFTWVWKMKTVLRYYNIRHNISKPRVFNRYYFHSILISWAYSSFPKISIPDFNITVYVCSMYISSTITIFSFLICFFAFPKSKMNNIYLCRCTPSFLQFLHSVAVTLLYFDVKSKLLFHIPLQC